MRIAWLTDIHLNFLVPREIDLFISKVKKTNPDVVIITGDIGESHDFEEHLVKMTCDLATPILFTLGNHDFYGSSFRKVKEQAKQLIAKDDNLTWLSVSRPVQLWETIALVGHDSWADGRFGDYGGSDVELSDFYTIEDFMFLDKKDRLEVMQAAADEAVRHLSEVLPKALDMADHVIVATHVPPFREASWYRGKVSDDDYLPHFSCKAVGDVILDAMADRDEKKLTVLCGHTHGSGEAQISDSVLALTGKARYGHPEIQQIFEFD
jgi:predicted MPP superfamily phosphohydrolase